MVYSCSGTEFLLPGGTEFLESGARLSCIQPQGYGVH